MSFNRLIYDQPAFEEKTTQRTLPGDYRLFPGQNFNHTRCISSVGPRPNRLNNNNEITQPQSWKGLAEIESALKNIDTPHAKYRDGRLLEDKRKKLMSQSTGYEAFECNNFIRSEDTRLTNNAIEYRGIYWGRMGHKGFPIRDPRTFVFDGHNVTTQNAFNNDNQMNPINVRFGVDTRLEFRDNYKMRVPIVLPDGVSPGNVIKN